MFMIQAFSQIKSGDHVIISNRILLNKINALTSLIEDFKKEVFFLFNNMNEEFEQLNSTE